MKARPPLPPPPVPAPPWPALLLLGPTGSGKTPLGELLARKGFAGRPCAHLDFGQCLRDVAASRGDAWGLDPGERCRVEDVLHRGALLEEADADIALKILDAFAARRLPPGGRLVMNGLPRHLGQARLLESRLRVDVVVRLVCSPAAVRTRMRRDPGGDRAGREDDRPDAVERRLAIYEERTAPLAAHYVVRGARQLDLPVGSDTTAEAAWCALDRARPAGG